MGKVVIDRYKELPTKVSSFHGLNHLMFLDMQLLQCILETACSTDEDPVLVFVQELYVFKVWMDVKG